MATPEAPLTGGCACGTVRFEVTAPFQTAGYCHCKRCQRRSGALWSENGIVDAGAFRLVSGAEAVSSWQPPDGLSKSFCSRCGGHVFTGKPGGNGIGRPQGAPSLVEHGGSGEAFAPVRRLCRFGCREGCRS